MQGAATARLCPDVGNYFTTEPAADPNAWFSEDCLRNLVIYSPEGREMGKISCLAMMGCPDKVAWERRGRASPRTRAPPEDSPRRNGQRRRKAPAGTAAGCPQEFRLNPCPVCGVERAKLLEGLSSPLARSCSSVESTKLLEGSQTLLASPCSKMGPCAESIKLLEGSQTLLASPCSKMGPCAERTKLLEGSQTLLASPCSKMESLCGSNGSHVSAFQPGSDSPHRSRAGSEGPPLGFAPQLKARSSWLESAGGLPPGWTRASEVSPPLSASGTRQQHSNPGHSPPHSRPAARKHAGPPQSGSQQAPPASRRSTETSHPASISPRRSETAQAQPAPGPTRPHSRSGLSSQAQTPRRGSTSTSASAPKQLKETSRSRSGTVQIRQANSGARTPQSRHAKANGSAGLVNAPRTQPSSGLLKYSNPYLPHAHASATKNDGKNGSAAGTKQRVHISHNHRSSDRLSHPKGYHYHAKPDDIKQANVDYYISNNDKTSQFSTLVSQAIYEPVERTSEPQADTSAKQVNNGFHVDSPMRLRNHVDASPSPSNSIAFNPGQKSSGVDPLWFFPASPDPSSSYPAGGASTPPPSESFTPKRLPPEATASPFELPPLWYAGKPPSPSASGPSGDLTGTRSSSGYALVDVGQPSPSASSAQKAAASQSPSASGLIGKAEPISPPPTSNPTGHPSASPSDSNHGQIRNGLHSSSNVDSTSQAKASGQVKHLPGSLPPPADDPVDNPAIAPLPSGSDTRRHQATSPGLPKSGPVASGPPSGAGTKRNSSTSPMNSSVGLVRTSDSSPSQSGAGTKRNSATSPMTSSSGLVKSSDTSPFQSQPGTKRNSSTSPMTSSSGLAKSQNGTVPSHSMAGATKDSTTSPYVSSSSQSTYPYGSSSRSGDRTTRDSATSSTPPRVSPKKPLATTEPDHMKPVDVSHPHTCPCRGDKKELHPLHTLDPAICANASHSHCRNSERPVPTPVKCHTIPHDIPCPQQSTNSCQPVPCVARCPHYISRATSCSKASHSHCNGGHSRRAEPPWHHPAKCPAVPHAIPPAPSRCSNASHSHGSPCPPARGESSGRHPNPCPAPIPVSTPVNCSNPYHSHCNPSPTKHSGQREPAAAHGPARCPLTAQPSPRPVTCSNPYHSHAGTGPKKTNEPCPHHSPDCGKCCPAISPPHPPPNTVRCSNRYHSHVSLAPMCHA
ncbi:serine/arginine repetitive matrix protein 2-like [Leucoraja erinacea]|uniref:serine/arginine repetitive matrix protein 2-like n=1 Tax=Leucoraja erinaceus TaxID=7782 RepID=UPI002458C3CD|nr:serine/arginine repetitive matrix protein 2-like [Leucoraja erinacea]XP_055521717.1 serine/arginine repetitive matrix protein 2-like [Leucoraja erinacea]